MNIAAYIDHTLLDPTATVDDIRRLCDEAKAHGFCAVCVNPCFAGFCSELLKGTDVRVCTVAGFPLGASIDEIKASEARHAVQDGADEIDMVINLGALKACDNETVLRDIRGVADACREGGALCKVIIEAACLTDEEKKRACRIAAEAGADFVKTSTGFGPGGATVEDVALMSAAVAGTKMGVKAAGGIKTLADAERMIAAGATRIGASAGVKIVREAGGVQ
jgi:deoxyribose-phosphate aldolase